MDPNDQSQGGNDQNPIGPPNGQMPPQSPQGDTGQLPIGNDMEEELPPPPPVVEVPPSTDPAGNPSGQPHL